MALQTDADDRGQNKGMKKYLFFYSKDSAIYRIISSVVFYTTISHFGLDIKVCRLKCYTIMDIRLCKQLIMGSSSKPEDYYVA